ncbi:MAG TPA: SH3 domain-containing protein [Verrucomicrobiae bacterium]|jgi:mannosyl-glycoprotein endo-beta-N-acetylglucosaminidase|nr:SH3 domain-containing protein [Verrucomicrobiae bacterium]
MRVLMVALVMGATSIASLGIAQGAPLGTPVVAQPSLLQMVADQEMTVTGTAVNVRQHPTSSSKVLTKLNSGAKVMAVGSSGSWTRVKINGMDGYISTRFLK